jgi:hypothetical protein
VSSYLDYGQGPLNPSTDTEEFYIPVNGEYSPGPVTITDRLNVTVFTVNHPNFSPRELVLKILNNYQHPRDSEISKLEEKDDPRRWTSDRLILTTITQIRQVVEHRSKGKGRASSFLMLMVLYMMKNTKNLEKKRNSKNFLFLQEKIIFRSIFVLLESMKARLFGNVN